MADWPVLVLAVLLIVAGLAAVVLMVHRLRSRRTIAAATAAHKEVRLPPPFPAHLASPVPLVPAAPSRLMAPQVPGRHSHEHLRLDAPTEQLFAVPAPTVAQPETPPRGHRAATPDRPANAPTGSDSGGHRAHPRVDAGTPAGARLTAHR